MIDLLVRYQQRPSVESNKEKTVVTTCTIDCGGKCPLNVHVSNGSIRRITVHNDGKLPPLKACVRGLNYHYRVYAPDRLKYPLKRVGERGSGRFRRISWDEALDIVAGEMRRIKTTYGPEAIFECTNSGSHICLLHNTFLGATYRLLNKFGGRTAFGTMTSGVGAFWASQFTYGITSQDSNSFSDLINSKLVILWGYNLVETHMSTPSLYWFDQARKMGIKFIYVDPCYTETARHFNAEWIPIRPSTDTAMLITMAYVMITEGLYDREFINRYVFGFDKYREYVLGLTDNTPKTPEWAEKITGVPADAITELAREYATSKPVALLAGFAPGRSAAGEQYHRAACTLSAMTGNIGVSGGGPAGLDLGHRPAAEVSVSDDYLKIYSDVDETPNPVEKGAPLHEYCVTGIRTHTVDKVHPSRVWDSILRGKAGGYFSDIKMLYVTNSDCLNQFPDVNRGVQALNKLEFVVVHDQFMTPTARHADIVLPVCTWFERNDLKVPWQFGHYFVYLNKAVEPMYNTKTDLQIFTELSEKMGIADFAEKTEDEWLRAIAANKGIPDYEAFKTTGFYQPSRSGDYIAFEPQIRDPDHNPFPTPSGKIEIFSQRIADFHRPDVLPPIPKYVESWEGVSDPQRKEYPLQLITVHPRNRVHSQLYNVHWLRDIDTHAVWINPADARSRKIRDGEQVKVYNDRGVILVTASITERIIEGVAAIYEGAWYTPDESGVDHGGCANVLTRGEHSPGGAYCSNTILVQIEKE